MHSRTIPVLPAAVLFDMVGTLVDTEHLWLGTVTETARRLGQGPTDADLPDVLGRPAGRSLATCTVSPAAPCPWRGSSGIWTPPSQPGWPNRPGCDGVRCDCTASYGTRAYPRPW